MRLGGRIQAAAEVLKDILERKTPATMALRDWGKAHRFAGSKDRSAIGNYVHDALRCKSSLAFRMDDDSPRSLALASAVFMGGRTVQELMDAFEGDEHAPTMLSNDEQAKLSGSINIEAAPDWIKADVPEWLWPAFETNFDEEALTEGKALTSRPPLDLRVNTIKAKRSEILKSLNVENIKPTEISPIGLRVEAALADARLPNVQIEEEYQTGAIEIQDEGSQIVSLLVDAKPGEKVLDYCAGGGGKSLALAADMENKGSVFGFDIDKRRLSPLYQRAQRAGASIIDVRQPPSESLKDLVGKMDRVLVDAPCTGVGTWRRKPDAKWRLSEDALVRRNNEQRSVLNSAKGFVRPGGLLFYVTCSMLAEENEAQVYEFLENHENFALLSAGEVWEEKFGVDAPKPWSADGCSLTLTPASTQTDGFFFAVMERQK
ncbi:16S rRNA (cytosine967-C5)-methyltransferase [Litorimonas taeanensis]|uniref:16S rRNA (Cytosine967-C5)-methyltransferase n=1 Tax=Litorimonas taeanensis TaxID=568099 RepID=A0A420WK93_9PROT|nr:RsmB/NOP family class I SAM-dependent RNA methyltransferase [Litorimonas taeanensis]RKQ71356.1 16S rRNA (cytosine967-C5)-methyltransferase [Litorimonas taeanensis]